MSAASNSTSIYIRLRLHIWVQGVSVGFARGVNTTSTYGTSIQNVFKYCILSKERKSKEIILIQKKFKILYQFKWGCANALILGFLYRKISYFSLLNTKKSIEFCSSYPSGPKLGMHGPYGFPQKCYFGIFPIFIFWPPKMTPM